MKHNKAYPSSQHKKQLQCSLATSRFGYCGFNLSRIFICDHIADLPHDFAVFIAIFLPSKLDQSRYVIYVLQIREHEH